MGSRAVDAELLGWVDPEGSLRVEAPKGLMCRVTRQALHHPWGGCHGVITREGEPEA